LDNALLDTLATEAELNRVAEYEGMIRDGDEGNVEGLVDAGAAEQAEEGENAEAATNEDAEEEGGQPGSEEMHVQPGSEEVDVQPVMQDDEEDAVEAEVVDSSGDEDETLTLTQLGERAQIQQASEFETSGDANFTVWQLLVSEMSNSITVNSEYLQQTKLREKIPIAYCLNVKNIASLDSFIPAILVRVGKKLWEVMDENDDELMEQLDWDGDEGIANMIGMYIRHPSKSFCDHFQSRAMVSADDKCNKEIDGKEVTPRRREMRKRAHEKLVKAAYSVQKRIINEVGEDNKLCEVGEVVHVPLKDLDKAKVDPGTLTGVIVQVDKGRSQARVAVKSGLLKSWYVYHRLGRVTGRGNNVQLNGLTEALKNWNKMPVITEREAARNESLVGGQGKGDVTCNCKGPCNTDRCSCKKAGRICSSACHRNNSKCSNHDRND
jgi:hypothetical protein